jgi:osmoprotectant transport system permease protein
MNWNERRFSGNWDVVWHYTVIHVQLTVVSMLLGVLLAAPLVYLAHRRPRWYPTMLAVGNVLYAIPSITLFVVLGPLLGGYTTSRPVVAAMALYTLVILVRNSVEGLRSVPGHVVTAATGMGYGSLHRFLAVELPMAAPGIVAGLRVATVSTISLITVGGLVGQGGLGRLFADGFARRIPQELWAGLGAVVVLALVADAIIVLVARVLTPWRRAERQVARA